MFNFLGMIGNYEMRKVANFCDGILEVDTASVTDGAHPFETAVAHPDFNDGKWVIVEAYDTKEAAQIGHDKWVKKMTTDIPDELVDCQNSQISQMIGVLDVEDLKFKRTISIKES